MKTDTMFKKAYLKVINVLAKEDTYFAALKLQSGLSEVSVLKVIAHLDRLDLIYREGSYRKRIKWTKKGIQFINAYNIINEILNEK